MEVGQSPESRSNKDILRYTQPHTHWLLLLCKWTGLQIIQKEESNVAAADDIGHHRNKNKFITGIEIEIEGHNWILSSALFEGPDACLWTF